MGEQLRWAELVDLAEDRSVEVPDLGAGVQLDDTGELVEVPARVAELDPAELLSGVTAPRESAADAALPACFEQAGTPEELPLGRDRLTPAEPHRPRPGVC